MLSTLPTEHPDLPRFCVPLGLLGISTLPCVTPAIAHISSTRGTTTETFEPFCASRNSVRQQSRAIVNRTAPMSRTWVRLVRTIDVGKYALKVHRAFGVDDEAGTDRRSVTPKKAGHGECAQDLPWSEWRTKNLVWMFVGCCAAHVVRGSNRDT
jgi:hypothetical protein